VSRALTLFLSLSVNVHGGTRTHSLRLRRATLYPIELHGPIARNPSRIPLLRKATVPALQLLSTASDADATPPPFRLSHRSAGSIRPVPASPPSHSHGSPAVPATPLTPIVAITFLLSLGTGMLWNGLPFVTENAFGYQRIDTYWLSATQGVFYVLAAMFAGRITRAAERHVSPRALLAIVLLLQGLLAPLILLQVTPAVVWFIACAVSATSALQWPIIESYVTAGRPGRAMRSAIGWWNVVWMTATLLSLALTGVMIEHLGPTLAIGMLGPVNLLATGLLLFIHRSPGEHLHDESEPVPATYRSQLAAARVLLPLSYVIVAALAPLMPFITGPLHLHGSIETVVASTWLGGRLCAAAVLWRTHSWHGRWATLLIAGALIAGGFAAAVLATSIPVLILGLGAFGVGQGIIYYAAIYYAMAVGNAGVDAAGTHEALIGLGYFIGPALGLLSTLASDNDIGRNQIFVLAVWSLMGLAAIPASRPWIRERASNRAAG
jgi:hypothetical protein